MAAPPPARADPAIVVREILLASVGASIAVVVLGILAGSGVLPDPRAPRNLALGFLYSPLSLLAGAGIYGLAARRLDGEPTPPLVPAGGRPGLPGALREAAVHALLALLGSYAIGVVMTLLGAPVVEQAPILEITAGGLQLRPDLVLLFVSALVLAPLAEECLLRGLLFRRLCLFATPSAAYVTTAVAFALLHGNLQGFVVYLWLGLCFARAYARSGRLWVAIAAHVGNNAITLAVLLARGSP